MEKRGGVAGEGLLGREGTFSVVWMKKKGGGEGCEGEKRNVPCRARRAGIDASF
jgi:hypothetical protein